MEVDVKLLLFGYIVFFSICNAVAAAACYICAFFLERKFRSFSKRVTVDGFLMRILHFKGIFGEKKQSISIPGLAIELTGIMYFPAMELFSLVAGYLFNDLIWVCRTCFALMVIVGFALIIFCIVFSRNAEIIDDKLEELEEDDDQSEEKKIEGFKQAVKNEIMLEETTGDFEETVDMKSGKFFVSQNSIIDEFKDIILERMKNEDISDEHDEDLLEKYIASHKDELLEEFRQFKISKAKSKNQ